MVVQLRRNKKKPSNIKVVAPTNLELCHGLWRAQISDLESLAPQSRSLRWKSDFIAHGA
jgi:hypothetical protein